MRLPRLNRRRFLFLSGLGLAAGVGSRYRHRPVRLGMIGAGIQGNNLATGVWRTRAWGGPCGRFVAVSDVDREHSARFKERWCPDAEAYVDYRPLLERDDVDAVLVATPDHWHARVILDALNAGKAVYGEKPLGLTIAEGRLLVDAVARTGAVFQGGTFQRSLYTFRTATELIRAGALGPIRDIEITLPVRWAQGPQGPFEPETPPAHLDWERWLGQAPLVPYTPQRCHGLFRRWFEYAGGSVTDWGVHYLDIVDLVLGEGGASPLTVEATAKLPDTPGGFNTPTDFEAWLEYPGGVRVHLRGDPSPGQGGIRFQGESSWLAASRTTLTGPAAEEWKRGHRHGPVVQQFQGMGGTSINGFMYHLRNFFACVRGDETPRSDVAGMHRSSAVCHLINIAIRTGSKLRWDGANERVVANDRANALLSRDQRPPYRVSA